MVEPKYPGAVERYVNMGDCYDKAALWLRRREIMDCMSGYKSCYQRAYRCLDAAAEIMEDQRAALLTDALSQKLAKRAAGIISRELKKPAGGDGRADQRFLSAVTHKGPLTLWGTVEAQAGRVYELADSSGLAHHLLNPILTAGLAAGHRAVACPDPMAPDRLAHVLFPDLALAFVSSSPEQPWPHRAYRRLRLDAMVDADACRAAKPRLRFTRRVAAALTEEAVAGLAQAKAAHDRLERLYNPFVDFDAVMDTADRLADEILSLDRI